MFEEFILFTVITCVITYTIYVKTGVFFFFSRTVHSTFIIYISSRRHSDNIMLNWKSQHHNITFIIRSMNYNLSISKYHKWKDCNSKFWYNFYTFFLHFEHILIVVILLYDLSVFFWIISCRHLYILRKFRESLFKEAKMLAVMK